jgi:hypothetical protein
MLPGLFADHDATSRQGLPLEAPDRNAHFAAWQHGSAPSARRRVTLHFCPDAKRCAFVMTDHGDRSSVSVTRAVYRGHSRTDHPQYGKRGILAAGVRVTQGVFWSGWDGYDYLENPEFYALMKGVQESGCEVCPHNTSEQFFLPPDEVRGNIRKYAQHFGLTTWIDHYRLASNLTREGMNPRSEHHVLDLLKSLGLKAAWSYWDAFANPPGPQLNCLNPPSCWQYLARLLRDAAPWRGRARASRSLTVSLTSLVHRAIGSDAFGNLFDLAMGLSGQPCVAPGVALRQLAASVAGMLFGSSRRPPPRFPIRWDEAHGLYWFDTVRIARVSAAYDQTALEHLIGEAGFHIGHTYLGFQSPRHSDLAFSPDGDGFAVEERFQRFLDVLSAGIRQGQVWNPTIREMIGYYEALAAVRLTPEADSRWRLVNTAAAPVEGVTLRSLAPLRVAADVAVRSRQVGREYWHCLDLPPHAAVSLAEAS